MPIPAKVLTATLLLFLIPLIFDSKLVLASPGEYLTKNEFLSIAFPLSSREPSETNDANPYKMETLWLTKEIKQKAENISGHPLKKLRVRYWRRKNRTAWIIDEIGKVKPITTGVIIEDSIIQSVHILAFRESRGWEVKFPFFTDQFLRAALDNNNNLDKNIDGITGATLSVRAVKKVARLALYFQLVSRDGT